MADALPDLSGLFPDSDAQRFARAGFEAIYRLATMLESLTLDEGGSGLMSNVYDLDKRLNETNQKIDALDELLNAVLKTLLSVRGDVPPDDAAA